MKNFLMLLAILLFPQILFGQGNINLNLRDIDYTEFQQIKLYLNILDSTGKPVNSIDSTQISIIEQTTGKKVSPVVKNFFKSDEGMIICFVIDASNSMDGAPLNNIKEGMLKILPEMRAQDKMAISTFNDKFFKQTGFETDREILRNNISEIETGGTSSQIYSSVVEATKWLKSIESPKRKVMILLSDGDDNGTEIKIEDCINELKNSGITVFSVGTVADTKNSRNTLQNIEKISNSTSDGKYYRINGVEDMKNIIPLIYERIKDEYVLTYFSYSSTDMEIPVKIQVKMGETVFEKEISYKSPSKIVKNAPAVSFWETKEFLFGSIGAGVVLITLGVFLVLNIRKKKKYKEEKELEHKLREEEAQINEERFALLNKEYDSLLDQLENASVITESDKIKISELERKIESASKTIAGVQPNVDFRRKTMILNSKIEQNNIPQSFSGASVVILNGYYAGNTFNIPHSGITFGRQQGEVILQDNTISRVHSKISFSNGSYYIEDLGSTNGTFVNERQISKSILNNNDNIRLGSISFTFKTF